jgi:hypothetical protein
MTTSRTKTIHSTLTLLAALAALTILAGAFSGCAGSLTDPAAFMSNDAGATVDAAVSGDAATSCPDIPTLFVQSCGLSGCHDATTKVEGLDLVSPGLTSRLVGVSSVEGNGLLINSTNPSASVIYTKVTSTPPFGVRMPSGSSLSNADQQCVLAWVTSVVPPGAPPMMGSDASVPPPSTDSGSAPDTGTVTAFTPIRVGAGQTAPVVDGQNNTWAADEDFMNGTGLPPSSPMVTVTGTDTSALYNGQRYGNPNFTYTFTVPNGTYVVTLKFAELYVTAAAQRLFNIALNGTAIETNFDIFAEAGGMNIALDKTYPPVTVTGGMIQLSFTAGTIQSPKVDAILITQQGQDGG